MPTQLEKARSFADAHRGPGLLVLPNAWDPGSAVMLVEAGFPFVATTSAGVAFAQGLPDGQRLSRDRMLELVGAITAAVDVPVSADLEAGYGSAPEDVAATVEGAIAAGAVGCNIEDSTGDPQQPLYDLDLATVRIEAGARAAQASGLPFVLNARADPYLVRSGSAEENCAESVRRAQAYLGAGAGCVYVPGVMDRDTVGALVREIDGPLNILAAAGGVESRLTAPELEALGVRRATIGGSLALGALAFVRRAADELRATGRFSYAADALRGADANAIMGRHADRTGR